MEGPTAGPPGGPCQARPEAGAASASWERLRLCYLNPLRRWKKNDQCGKGLLECLPPWSSRIPERALPHPGSYGFLLGGPGNMQRPARPCPRVTPLSLGEIPFLAWRKHSLFWPLLRRQHHPVGKAGGLKKLCDLG